MIINKINILQVSHSLKFTHHNGFKKTSKGFLLNKDVFDDDDYYLAESDKNLKIIDDKVFIKPYVEIKIKGKSVLRQYFEEIGEAGYLFASLKSELNNKYTFIEFTDEWKQY